MAETSLNGTSAAAPPEAIVVAWWQDLQNNPGERAELRRAGSLLEVSLAPAFHNLYRQLADTKWRNPDRVALVAGALAHAKALGAESSKKVAAQLASPTRQKANAAMSGLRFRRLLQLRSPEELLVPMIRALRLLHGEGNLADLATSLYYWNDRTRRDWAFAYYEKSPGQQ